MGIFDKRKNYKPFEYPQVEPLIKTMNQTFWTVDEVDFTGDVQDFKARLNPIERDIFKKSLLSIAQVEVDVKLFWGKLYDYFPKPEFNNLGATFAESEIRHGNGYSRLLEVLGYEKDFETLLENPVFQHKLQLLEESMTSKTDIVEKLLFFTIVIENTSLFSQFANILSFSRFKGLMKNVVNIINWTAIEEDVHSNAGILLINLIQQEYPDKIEKLKKGLKKSILKYIQYEQELLDWIFEKGELEFYTKNDLLNFMKYRIDDALVKMNFEPIFNVSKMDFDKMAWFYEETKIQTLPDFFAIRPVEYSKHNQPFNEDNLF